jgi:hypothetical protein
MTSSVHSVQSAQSQKETEQTVQPPKTLQVQTQAQLAGVQDTVTISQEARQALTHSNTDAGGGAPNDHVNKAKGI